MSRSRTYNGFVTTKMEYSNAKVLSSYERANITEVEIPKGIAIIGGFSFKDNNAIEKVTIPEGVIRIGNSAFNGCTHLVEVDFPSTLREIAPYAFINCPKLKSVTIGENVVYHQKSFDPTTEVIVKPVATSATSTTRKRSR